MTLIMWITIFCWLAGLGGCGEYLVMAIIGTIMLVAYYGRESSFNNYTPPKGINYSRLNSDIKNGVSPQEIKRRTLKGVYDNK